jgi:thiol-disulfide isomerase/thioredoxin
MKKHILLIFLLNWIGLNSFCQTYKALKIGDHVPDITIRGFFDDEQKSAKLSDLYKDKLLILDFWGTWCGACLNEMLTFPKLKSQFGDKLNIVTVGYERKEVIAKLFKRSPEYHSNQWVTLYGDSTLTTKLFPHKLLPHLAWINSEGKVVGITDAEYLNSKNIMAALAGKEINARLKQDILGVDDIFKPFQLMDSNFTARSILTRSIPGGASFDSKQPYTLTKPYKYSRVYMVNENIGDMYWFALADGKTVYGNYARLRFEIKDSLKFSHPKHAPQSFKLSTYTNYDDWADSNLYCYDLVLPKLVPDSVIKKYTLADLNRYFNLNGRWESRLIDCYIIKDQIDKAEQLSIVTSEFNTTDSTLAKIGEIENSALANFFNTRLKSGYILNESKRAPGSKITIDERYRVLNQYQIATILKRAGLLLIQAKRRIMVYVVSEI